MSRPKPPVQVIAEPVGLDLEPLVLKAKNRPKVPPATRAAVYKRDHYKCVYCGSTEDLTIDHKIPVSKGGKNKKDNMVTACSDCNGQKADGHAPRRVTGKPRPARRKNP